MCHLRTAGTSAAPVCPETGLPGTVYTLVLNSLVITRSRPDAPAGSLTADQVGGHVLALHVALQVSALVDAGASLAVETETGGTIMQPFYSTLGVTIVHSFSFVPHVKKAFHDP